MVHVKCFLCIQHMPVVVTLASTHVDHQFLGRYQPQVRDGVFIYCYIENRLYMQQLKIITESFCRLEFEERLLGWFWRRAAQGVAVDMLAWVFSSKGFRGAEGLSPGWQLAGHW